MDENLEWVRHTVEDYDASIVVQEVLRKVIKDRFYTQLSSYKKSTIVIGKSGFDNYGHVLTDILPKLVNVSRSSISNIRLLLPSGMGKWCEIISAIMREQGSEVDIELQLPGTLKEVRNVFAFTPVSQHNTRKSAAMLELVAIIKSIYGLGDSSYQRIHVRRNGRESRSIRNIEEVERTLSALNFVSVEPAALDFEHQVRLFSAAEVIIGPLGAGLTNMAWSSSQCEVIMIDPGIGDYFFWDLSCLAKQSFHWLFAGALRKVNNALMNQSYDVDIEMLDHVLADVIY